MEKQNASYFLRKSGIFIETFRKRKIIYIMRSMEYAPGTFTHKPDHPHSATIDALGGPAELARTLSAKEAKAGRNAISRQTVQGWKKRGIPARIQLRYKSYFGKL